MQTLRPFSSTQSISSKKGHHISIIPYEERYFTLDKNKRCQWVQDMISRGTNLLALYRDTVIGQASLFSMPVNWAEYFIFIHQDFQRQGIGTAITLYVKDWAKQESISCIWVIVDRKNFLAISLCLNVGFRRIGSSGADWEMILTINKE